MDCLDKQVRVWSRETSSLSKPLTPDYLACRLRGCSTDENVVLLSCPRTSSSAELLLYKLAEGILFSYRYPGNADHAVVALSSRRVLAASLPNDTVELFNWDTGSCSRLENKSSAEPRQLVFSPNGELLVSSSTDGNVYLWKLSTLDKRLVGTFSSHPNLAFSPHNMQIATSDAYTIAILDLQETTNPSIGHASKIAGPILFP